MVFLTADFFSLTVVKQRLKGKASPLSPVSAGPSVRLVASIHFCSSRSRAYFNHPIYIVFIGQSGQELSPIVEKLELCGTGLV